MDGGKTIDSVRVKGRQQRRQANWNRCQKGLLVGLDREAVREVDLVDHFLLFRIKVRTPNQFSMPIYKGWEQ